MTTSLRGVLPSPDLEIVLALTALFAGAIIGTERERHDKPAGLRTLILVCLGAAVYTMASYLFATPSGDPGRIAAQIVTGVGFLGAGAILQSGGIVSGMTTAATVWMTAAVGIVAGSGFPLSAIGAASLVRIVLVWVERWEVRHLGGMRQVSIAIVFDPANGKTRLRLQNLLGQFRGVTDSFTVDDAPDSLKKVHFELRLPRRHLNEFLNALTLLPEVHGIECNDCGALKR